MLVFGWENFSINSCGHGCNVTHVAKFSKCLNLMVSLSFLSVCNLMVSL